MWKKYENFRLASYVFAYYLDGVTDEELQADIDHFLSYAPLEKVYLENHRANTDIPQERMREIKAIFEKNGIQCSGGITSTVLIEKQKPAIFDTFCFSDKAHRDRYLQIVRELAEVFDEIILDDFFFQACRCDLCIAAKKDRTWSQYRLDLMEEFSHEIVDLAHSINPKLNFIIKYPAWYKSYHETGYNPEKQRYIFDSVYTGTETRLPDYDTQHFQRYHSYSIMRWMENAVPGRNGGGWIDSGGSGHSINVFLEQVEQTAFAGAKELTFFQLKSFTEPDNLNLPAAAKDLYRVDNIVGQLGNPVGTVVYEPFQSDGEDMVYNYLGMRGLAFEPKQEFDFDASAMLLTGSSAKDPDVIEKLKQYLTKGGTAIITTGFVHATWDRGIRDITSMQFTNRFLEGNEYMTCDRNHSNEAGTFKGTEKVSVEILTHKDNAAWTDVVIKDREYNCVLLSEEDYSKGQVFLLNLPFNFADLYRIPAGPMQVIAKHLSVGQRVYVTSEEKICLYTYDNDIFGLQNFESYGGTVRVYIRGNCKKLRNIENGTLLDQVMPMPAPSVFGDAASTLPEEPESYIDVKLGSGQYQFFEIISE